MILDALTLSEQDAPVRSLVDAFGSDVVAIAERRIGEPAYLSRRLAFASGGEIILHDDSVVAVVLHLSPTAFDLSDWIFDVDNSATLDELQKAMGSAPHFAGIGTPYFTVGGGYVRANFRDKRGWKDAGNLLSLTFTVDKPGLSCRPEDDNCPACSELLIRNANGKLDVDGTVESLAAALAVGSLTEDAHWVKLADLQPLHASALMARVETQLTCTTCRRIICFTLFRDASPTFEYLVTNDAMRHPLEPIPPVEQWGDADRLALDRDAMHYVDHEPAMWFLVRQGDALYLDARYSYSAMIDDSALILLNDSELADFRSGGHDAITRLARRIHNSAPYREESPYYLRNLYRGDGGQEHRKAVGAAIVNHTWLAQQRKP